MMRAADFFSVATNFCVAFLTTNAENLEFLWNLIVRESNKAGKCISFPCVVVKDIWFFYGWKNNLK